MADTKTEPTKGAGTQLFMAATPGAAKPAESESNWSRLAKIKELTPPEISAEDQEDNYLDDANPDWRSSTPGQKDAGELSVTLAWLPGDAGQKELVNAVGGEPRWFKIKYPNDAYDLMFGYVSKVGKAVPQKEVMTRSVTIRLSGKPDLEEARTA